MCKAKFEIKRCRGWVKPSFFRLNNAGLFYGFGFEVSFPMKKLGPSLATEKQAEKKARGGSKYRQLTRAIRCALKAGLGRWHML